MYLLASAYLLESINQSEIKSKYWFQEDKLFFQPQNTPILAKKSLKLHFLQNFPGFHFVFNCSDSVHMWTIISHWQNIWDTLDLVITSHRHGELRRTFCFTVDMIWSIGENASGIDIGCCPRLESVELFFFSVLFLMWNSVLFLSRLFNFLLYICAKDLL